VNKTLDKAIRPLIKLMESFGMDTSDWCISGEYAWILNGYDVPMRENHIDIYVKESKIPWKVRDRVQTVPPKGTPELEAYSKYIEKYNIALHMVPLPKPKVTERLIDTYSFKTRVGGADVSVINPTGNLFDLETTLGVYSAEELGQDRLSRWQSYLEAVYKVTSTKDDKRFTEKSKHLLEKYFHFKSITKA